MSGFQLLEKARELYPTVPFVLWTGFWEKDQVEKARSYERVEMMTKPFSLKQVQEVLNRIQEMKLPSMPLKGEAAARLA